MKLNYTKHIKASIKAAKEELTKGERAEIAKCIRATRQVMNLDRLSKEEIEKAIDKIEKIIRNAKN